jgi:hypothetical protein
MAFCSDLLEPPGTLGISLCRFREIGGFLTAPARGDRRLLLVSRLSSGAEPLIVRSCDSSDIVNSASRGCQSCMFHIVKQMGESARRLA